MENISKKLDLPRRTWGIACVLYHRSLLNFSKLENEREVDPILHTAACLFLASKVDDNPRALEAMIKLLLRNSLCGVKYEGDEKQIKEVLINLEFMILQTTGFDFEYELPYSYFDEVKSKIHHNDCSIIFKKAETFLNECFRSDICLYYPPSTLAAAALYMSSRYLRIDLQEVINKTTGGDLTVSTDISTRGKSPFALQIPTLATPLNINQPQQRTSEHLQQQQEVVQLEQAEEETKEEVEKEEMEIEDNQHWEYFIMEEEDALHNYRKGSELEIRLKRREQEERARNSRESRGSRSKENMNFCSKNEEEEKLSIRTSSSSFTKSEAECFGPCLGKREIASTTEMRQEVSRVDIFQDSNTSSGLVPNVHKLEIQFSAPAKKVCEITSKCLPSFLPKKQLKVQAHNLDSNSSLNPVREENLQSNFNQISESESTLGITEFTTMFINQLPTGVNGVGVSGEPKGEEESKDWWSIFDDEVNLEVIMEISQSIYQQLKFAKV